MWHHNAALLEAKNIFSDGLKKSRKICKAWQQYTENSLNKSMSPLQRRSHSDNSFLLICIEEFKLSFVGNQEWCSSFKFSSAFLLPENPFVVLVWHWTFKIILAMEGDKSQTYNDTRAWDEVERHRKLNPCRVEQDAFMQQFETSHRYHNSCSQESKCSLLVSPRGLQAKPWTCTMFCSTLKKHHTSELTAAKQVSSCGASKHHNQSS